jgi:hypothetical protein
VFSTVTLRPDGVLRVRITAGLFGCLHPAEPGYPDAGQLPAHVVELGSSHAERRPWPGLAGTPKSAVSTGPGSLAAGVSLINDILVYD